MELIILFLMTLVFSALSLWLSVHNYIKIKLFLSETQPVPLGLEGGLNALGGEAMTDFAKEIFNSADAFDRPTPTKPEDLV